MSIAFDFRSLTPDSVDPKALLHKRLLETSFKEPEPPAHSLSTGITELDLLLPGGGLPTGRLTEITGRIGSGKLTLALNIARLALERAESVVLVDASNSVMPPVRRYPVYQNMLVVRTSEPALALKAVDCLLRINVFLLVLLDLSVLRQAPSRAIVTRLGRETRQADTALVILSDPQSAPLAPAVAALRLTVEPAQEAEPRRDALQISVTRNKLGPEGTQILCSLACTNITPGNPDNFPKSTTNPSAKREVSMFAIRTPSATHSSTPTSAIKQGGC